MHAYRLMLVAATAMFSIPTPVGAQSIQYEGTARDLDSGVVLYRELHFINRDARGKGERVVLYKCPDGTPFARKLVEYVDRGLVPQFEMHDARLGYREGVRMQASQVDVFVQRRAAAPEKVGPLPSARGLVADTGFDDFVQSHWEELQQGKTVRFPFLLPSKLDYYNFKVTRDRGEVINGESVSVIRLGLGSWFGFLLPHIEVAYSDARRELLRFEGISNVRDETGTNYTARIDFPPAERRPLDVAAQAQARRVPLVGACRQSAS